MKTLRFNFFHPFKGNARINMPGKLNSPGNCFLLASRGINLIEIALIGFQDGVYKIAPDWGYGNQSFIHQREFEIKNQLVN